MRFGTDKRTLMIAAVVAALAVSVTAFVYSRSLAKEQSVLKTRLQEVLSLKNEFSMLRASVASVEGKRSLTKVEGIVQAVDEVFKSLGLNQKVRSVKPLGAREKPFGVEETAEVQVEKVNMNEMTNILYKVDNAPMILSIRKAVIKTSFENPSSLTLTLTISLIKPK